MVWILPKLSNYQQVAPSVRTGGSRHTGLAAPPHRNIHTASGAERAYRKAVDHLACLLTEAGVTYIRWTTTANGVRFRLILRLEQRRLSAWQSGIRWQARNLQKK